MKILGIDFESQSADPFTTNVTEVGALLVSTGTRRMELKPFPQYSLIQGLSALCSTPDYPPQTQEILDITGITDEMLREHGRPTLDVFKELICLVHEAELIMAHNKKFDQNVFESTCQRLGLEYPEREWICSYTEVPYPTKIRCHQLSHLALDHGVKMDGRVLHRAQEDVRLMLDLVLTHYDMHDVLEYKREPWVYLRAEILGPWEGRGGDGGVGKSLAQKLGYAWERAKGSDTPVFPKTWVKRVKAKDVEEQKRLAPFRVAVL